MRKTRGKGGATDTGADAAPDASTIAPATTSGKHPEPGPEATVAAYLLAHRDFFEHHPDLLSRLHLPHPSGAAVSLIERQVSVLRTQLETERGRLAHLIARAREYESFSARLHALVLALIATENLGQVRAVLEEALMREFSAQAVTLKLFTPGGAPTDADPDPIAAAFGEFLERKHALCGPLDEAKNAILFGDPGAPPDAPVISQVQCAALVPIHANGHSGVLAIGAADPDRFKPDMRTDLLDRLGEIVSQKLLMLPPESADQEPANQEPTTPAPQPAAPAPEAGAEPPPPKRKRARRTVPE